MPCTHLGTVHDVTPSARGCEECLKSGDPWVHLRLCRTCGHVGCCDSSPNRHATAHFHATGHPIVEGYDPPEHWGWCYADEVALDLSGPANGPARPDSPLRLMGDDTPTHDAAGHWRHLPALGAAAATLWFARFVRRWRAARPRSSCCPGCVRSTWTSPSASTAWRSPSRC